MKKDRVAASVICFLLAVMSIAIAVYYFSVYQSDTEGTGYLVLSLLGLAEALLAGVSFCFCLGCKKNAVALTVYVISAILAIPVLWVALMWLLYFAGLHLLPPPQQ